MEHQLKPISREGIPEALAKVELYRYLNQAEEAESICLDILAVEPEHQVALRQLGLAITDQFTGSPTDRYGDADAAFSRLTDAYECFYYGGLLHERRAKAQLHRGAAHEALASQFEEALRLYARAEEIRPPGNDDALLRWNRCVRLLGTLTRRPAPEVVEFEPLDSAPVPVAAARKTGTH